MPNYDPHQVLTHLISELVLKWRDEYHSFWQRSAPTEDAVPNSDSILQLREHVNSVYDALGLATNWLIGLEGGDGTYKLDLGSAGAIENAPPFVITQLLAAHSDHIAAHFDGYHPLRDRLEVALWHQTVERLRGAVERGMDLANVVVVTTDVRAASYLSRIAECYIFGLHTQGVAMCRAALEAVIKNYVGADDRDFNLYGSIKQLQSEGKLSPGAASAAHQVRVRGNRALHDLPGQDDLRDTISKLVEVFDHIYDATAAESVRVEGDILELFRKRANK